MNGHFVFLPLEAGVVFTRIGESRAVPHRATIPINANKSIFIADTVMMPAPTSKAPEKKASPLDKMTVEELREYADIQGIPLGTAKQKKTILKVIREAEAKAAEALKALQES